MKRVALRAISWMGAAVLLAAPGLMGSPAGQIKPSAPDLTASKSLGSRDAPITMEVFSDYECPQCRNFYQTTVQQLIDNYVNTGKVYLVHRDFPLPMHTYSHQAAQWLNAAAEAGQYAAVEQALYAKQDEWGSTGKIEPVLAAVLSPADMKKVGLIHATKSAEIDAAIERDLSLGHLRNVNGTPTIFITHRGQMTELPTGGVNYPLLKQYLDYLLQH